MTEETMVTAVHLMQHGEPGQPLPAQNERGAYHDSSHECQHVLVEHGAALCRSDHQQRNECSHRLRQTLQQAPDVWPPIIAETTGGQPDILLAYGKLQIAHGCTRCSGEAGLVRSTACLQLPVSSWISTRPNPIKRLRAAKDRASGARQDEDGRPFASCLCKSALLLVTLNLGGSVGSVETR